MAEYITRERETMFLDASKAAKSRLDKLCQNVREEMELKMKKIIVAIEEDYQTAFRNKKRRSQLSADDILTEQLQMAIKQAISEIRDEKSL